MNIRLKQHLLTLLAVPALVLGVAGLVAPPAYAETTPTTDCSTTGGIANAAKCAKGSDQPENLFENGGVFQKITDVLLFIIGAVSVIMFIIGGIRYTTSQGDSTAVTNAKNTLLYSVIGIVVALLAYAAVHFVIGSFVPDSNEAAQG